jgi:hypothetical protein
MPVADNIDDVVWDRLQNRQVDSYLNSRTSGTYLPSQSPAEGLQYTRSSLKLGQEMHKAYKIGDVLEGVAMKEFRGISGIRPDFVDFSTRTIYELKPFNPRAIQQGWNQLYNYQDLFQQKYGGTWKIVLDAY